MKTLRRSVQALVVRRPMGLGDRADQARRLSASQRDRQKMRVLLRQGFRCAACDIVITPDQCDADHVKPLGEGGSLRDWNVQGLCRECHAEKTAAEAKARAKRGRT